MDKPTIAKALAALFAWVKEHDYTGHDPHDLLNAPLFQNTRGGRRSREKAGVKSLTRLIALQFGRRSPIDVRELLRVPHKENAKGLALFISGLLRGREAATPNWLYEAQQLAKRLIKLQHPNGGWGYPFPWQSRTHFLPAGTPNIVTTSFAGNALIDLYGEHPTPEIRNAISSASNYITHDVPRVPSDLATQSGIAFGYAENDPQIVFNASLLGAEFLLNAAQLLGNEDYIALATRAAEFVAQHQQPDGSWLYGLEASQTWIDSFHTGFVVVSMKLIADALDRGGRAESTDLRESTHRGFEYYRKTFVEPDFAIRYFANKRYPIDAHALGQAMVTLATFGDIEAARRVAQWSIEHMRSPQGYFYYQKHRFFTNRIAYMRWSNAWMFRGLASLFSNE